MVSPSLSSSRGDVWHPQSLPSSASGRGGAGALSTAAKAAAVLRVWPLLAAVASVVLPRDCGDTGVGPMMLILAVHAFNAGRNSLASSYALVEAVLG